MLFFHYELGINTEENDSDSFDACCLKGSIKEANGRYFNAYIQHKDKLLCITSLNEEAKILEAAQDGCCFAARPFSE